MCWKSRFKKLLFSLLLLSRGVIAAPCCGSGFTIPSIITSDDRAQVAVSYSRALIHADVFTNGDWRERKEDDLTETLKLDGAHIFSDRYQLGFSLPIQKRTRTGAKSDSSTGLGDLALQVGYEFLPDWDYNPYRPKGIAYASLIAPTGRSIYESADGSGIDARGRGFWGGSLGVVLTKSWGAWDANTNIELHNSLPKNVSNATTRGLVKPSYGGSAALGGGYNWSDFRIGALINWQYEAPTDVEGSTPSRGSLRRLATGSLLASVLLPDNQSVVLSYSDQTIFGSPFNTTLAKTITLFFQQRWQR